MGADAPAVKQASIVKDHPGYLTNAPIQQSGEPTIPQAMATTQASRVSAVQGN